MDKKTVVIFAGSKLPTDDHHTVLARVFARKIGLEKFNLAYGGGNMGLMGEIARTAQTASAEITAFTLKKYGSEDQLMDAKVIEIDGDDDDRFKAFSKVENLAAFIAFPPGPGGIVEVAQAFRHAAYENGPPLIIPQIGHYYDGILASFAASAEGGLTKAETLSKVRPWKMTNTLKQILALE